LAGSDVLRFLLYNLKHYSLALWGLRLQLEPDYPVVERFFPSLIRDSVYEWRTYGGMILWAFLIVQLPRPVVLILLALWVKWSWTRVGYFKTNYGFWRQANWECPGKIRTRVQYYCWIIRETERRMKAGARSVDMAELDREAFRIQEEICKQR
jgi:hypothetical protein